MATHSTLLALFLIAKRKVIQLLSLVWLQHCPLLTQRVWESFVGFLMVENSLKPKDGYCWLSVY